MKLKLLNKILVIVSIGVFVCTSINGYSQNDEPVSEKLKSDALAMAQVSCDQSLSDLSYQLNKDNKELKKTFAELTLLMNRMNVTMYNRYSDEAQKRKFDREVKSAKKQLSKCIKYQNIQDAKAKEEKEKAAQAK